MKKLNALLIILFISTVSVFAQTPNKMSYQAVIRNSGDMILVSQSIGIQISILQSSPTGTAVYVETQNPTTNANGLISIEIGTGTVASGDFSTIEWANDSYYIKTEIDIAGGASYTITGTSQLMSVPYALHAKTAESISGSTDLADGTIFIGNGSDIAVSQTISSDATITNTGVLTIADNAVDGTDISLASEAAGDMAYFNGTDWVRLPKGTVGQTLTMNTGATAPEWKSDSATENVKDVLYTSNNTQLSNGNIGTIPFNWGDLVSQGYESVMFEMWESNVNAISQSVTISVESFIGETDKSINLYDNATDYVWVRSIDVSSNSFSIQCNASDAYKVRVYGIKAQKTVINVLNTPTNDQATSGYMDIGTMRVQWGIADSTSDAAETFNFPVAFGAVPVVQITRLEAGATNIMAISLVNTTSFIINRDNGISNPAPFNWFAIGVKP